MSTAAADEVRADDVRAALRELADPEKAKVLSRFFKTGPGQYSEGDIFCGVKVPQQRVVAKRYAALPMEELAALLHSKVHEERLTALLILVARFQKGQGALRRQCFDFYLDNLSWVNNWDLVDTSAAAIVGTWLLDKDRGQLYQMAESPSLWTRRVAIVSTHAFIRAGSSTDTFGLSQRLLGDSHDLMHKAVGWMLREVGAKVGADELRGFLARHAHEMPRTALRYAIEHFDVEERQRWMAQKSILHLVL